MPNKALVEERTKSGHVAATECIEGSAEPLDVVVFLHHRHRRSNLRVSLGPART
jgi:hypothetical protein